MASTHRIAADETFSSIAKAYYGDARLYYVIQKANPNVNPSRLRPGTMINLPARAAASDDTAAPSSALKNAGVASRSSSKGSAVTDSTREYVVKPSDSWYRISMKLYGRGDKADTLYEVNKDVIGSDPGKLKVGMILKLPVVPTQTAAR